MSDAAWTTVGLVAVAIITSILSPLLLGRFTVRRVESSIGQQIAETHRAVTKNHHSSETPTVLDRLSDLEDTVRQGFAHVDKRFDDGDARMKRQDDAIGLPPWKR